MVGTALIFLHYKCSLTSLLLYVPAEFRSDQFHTKRQEIPSPKLKFPSKATYKLDEGIFDVKNK